jgi:hypothetical protein
MTPPEPILTAKSPALPAGREVHNRKKITFPGSPTLMGVELHKKSLEDGLKI